MNIVFLSNYLNHHQKPLADELYRLTKGNFHYIASAPMSAERRKLGYKDVEAPYLIKCYSEPTPNPLVQKIIDTADAVIIGSAPDVYVANRVKLHKLIFKYSERLYKTNPGILRLLYHRLRFKYRYSRNPNCFLLCASAFTAEDYNRIGCFKRQAYKWGYFTDVQNLDIDEVILKKRQSSKIRILWVGRFLSWKHPEIAIEAALNLKDHGVDFEMNLYGIGPETNTIEQLIHTYGLDNYVSIRGAASNHSIINQMREHDIFLFTSDKNEGWGAVANEAMSNGCTLIASNAIGSIPYLVKNGYNGMIFNDCDSDDLYEKIMYLIQHPEERENMARAAYKTMSEKWSPQNAAKSLINLIESFYNGHMNAAESGPCSKA